jgi:hypothetical protein
MSGVQVLVMALALVNGLAAAVLADAMTWRTHGWWQSLRVTGCGLVACGCGWLGWMGVDLELAVCGQFLTLAALLHIYDRRGAPQKAAIDGAARAPVRATRGKHAQ